LLGKIGQLRHGMVFCDIGHGVGNLPIQASFCFGCESRGIEMVGERHEIAANFKEFMLGQHQRLSEKKGKASALSVVFLSSLSITIPY
jgi:precorrin-6B methylase 2